ncbi:hypothetical protein HGG64_01910 [Mycoplasma phocoeninasale]|uniref:Uncharacterized protein n=1 Tax=Mycoplasma phocoeninasale TaxID=2726117 RepID=A0A858U061_9MOLU|nr:hypothetical protein [Mycoplasma phocoeninasale]QJG66454.1 hypothetical protein HGG64_01910 [Mycoplasma phocoeninasale]
MKKFFISSLAISLLSVITITISATTTNSSSKENEKNSSSVLENDFIKDALKLKVVIREFNSKFYLFYTQYRGLSSTFKDLVEEQSIPELKATLDKYFKKNFDFKESNGRTQNFSELLYQLNWMINILSNRISDLNFFLENAEHENAGKMLENDSDGVTKNYKEYLYDSDFKFEILRSEKPPLINLLTAIKTNLNTIKGMIEKNDSLMKFINEYKEAKKAIYDNINHINLDINFEIINDILTNNNLEINIPKMLKLMT